jgi:hypothetical protein
MSNVYKGLCWAAAILLNALGNYLGYIDDNTAQTLFVVLPVIAVISIRDRRCLPLGKEA